MATAEANVRSDSPFSAPANGDICPEGGASLASVHSLNVQYIALLRLLTIHPPQSLPVLMT